jgi:hypothetical protein
MESLLRASTKVRETEIASVKASVSSVSHIQDGLRPARSVRRAASFGYHLVVGLEKVHMSLM